MLLLVLFCSVFALLQHTYNRQLLEKKRTRILRTKFILFTGGDLRYVVNITSALVCTIVVYGNANNCGLSVAVKDTPHASDEFL